MGGQNGFYLCGLIYSALESARVHYENCDHLSSRNKKKQAGSYFVMWAGLRNNEFCLWPNMYIHYNSNCSIVFIVYVITFSLGVTVLE